MGERLLSAFTLRWGRFPGAGFREGMLGTFASRSAEEVFVLEDLKREGNKGE